MATDFSSMKLGQNNSPLLPALYSLVLILVLSIELTYAQSPIYQRKIDSIKLILEDLANKNKPEVEIPLRWQLVELEVSNMDYTQSFIEATHLENLLAQVPPTDENQKIAVCLFDRMGWLMAGPEQYEESIRYHSMADSIARQLNLLEHSFKNRSSVAFYSHLLNRKELAYDIAAELMHEAENLDLPQLKVIYHNLYYLLYRADGEHAKQLYHVKLTVPDKDIRTGGYRLIKTGTAFKDLGILDSALIYTHQGLKVARDVDDKQMESNAHVQLRDIYEATGDFKNAFIHFQRFDQINRLNASYRSGIELGEYKRRYFEDKLELENQLANEKISNQRTVIWIVSISMILIFAAAVYILNKLKLIENQNKIIAKEKARAEESERHKEQFLANMSHEIRTPMHAISGMLNSLRRKKHPKSQTSYLDAMQQSADNLLNILNDALDMSKIESGTMHIEEVPIDPVSIVEHNIYIFQPKAKQKQISLALNIEHGFPSTMIGDPGRLSQIIMNLLSNAIKYTESGSVRVSLKQLGQKYIIIVKDTGIGISQDSLSTIFDVFHQGEKNGERGGTGLGLSICKRLVEMQGGRIWVESKINHGSTFFVELPLIIESVSKDSEIVLGEKELKALGMKLENTKLLIVEDNEFNRMVLEDDLKWYIPEIQLDFAEHGKEAFEMLTNGCYDAIIMDVQMPVMNGYDTTRKIRKWEISSGGPRIPIIGMTAAILEKQISQCFEAGMDSCISKPYKPTQIVCGLHDALMKEKLKPKEITMPS